MSDFFRYSNKFMYFILNRDESDERSWLYCSGVSMSRFLPVTRGRHGLASNPAMRGLQIVDLQLRKELIDHGARTEAVKGNPCDAVVPKEGDWYRQLLLIRDTDGQIVKELLGRCPLGLVNSVFKACRISDVELPETVPPASELESLLAEVCERYSKQSGWPTTASAKGFRK